MYKKQKFLTGFTKLVASGNDFVVVGPSVRLPVGQLKKIAQNICNRKFGIGADGLLVIEKSKIVDFKMRIFNPDGTEAEMCGNGSRCASFFAYENKIAKSKMQFETKAGLIEAQILDKETVSPHTKTTLTTFGVGVKIKMPPPKNIKLDIFIKINKRPICVNFIDTGVPHTVIFVNDLENIEVFNIGRAIRFHPKFAPRGTNVDFIEALNKNSLKIRTYERGVEDETLACGTGAVAAAVIFSIKSGNSNPKSSQVNVITKSSEKLKIIFDTYKNAWLEGKVKRVFQGYF